MTQKRYRIGADSYYYASCNICTAAKRMFCRQSVCEYFLPPHGQHVVERMFTDARPAQHTTIKILNVLQQQWKIVYGTWPFKPDVCVYNTHLMAFIHSWASSGVLADMRYTVWRPVHSHTHTLRHDCISAQRIYYLIYHTHTAWQATTKRPWPSITRPSEAVLQALMTSPLAASSSKQLGFLASVTSRTWMFSNGTIPFGSLSYKP